MPSISIEGMRGFRKVNVSRMLGRPQELFVSMLFFVTIHFCSRSALKEETGAASGAGSGKQAVLEDVFDAGCSRGFVICEQSGVRMIAVSFVLDRVSDTLRSADTPVSGISLTFFRHISLI